MGKGLPIKVLVLGKNGQLGAEILAALEKSGIDVTGIGRNECDITKLDKVKNLFDSVKPSIVINCAAYNRVDEAELSPSRAYSVNAVGARNVAYMCRKSGAYLIHFSTDYVFDGDKGSYYTENDKPNPVNHYGRSKLLGEEFVLEELSGYSLILRTSWLYGNGKQNFLHKLLTWLNQKNKVYVSCDEFSVPTSTRFVAEVVKGLLYEGITGTYHLVCKGYASRLEWAKSFLRFAEIHRTVYPAYASSFNLPARRPAFSAMSSERLEKLLNTSFPYWEDELRLCCMLFDFY